MTVIYSSPARPWAWGPLAGTDIVARQAEALVQRYDLLDALGAGGRVRCDLDPTTTADSRLREVIVRQLVPWVDYEPEAGSLDEGFPIPQGARVEALCYSPWIDPLRASDGTIAGKRVFALPNTACEFARQFYVRSGIRLGVDKTANPRGLADEFQHAFSFTPLVVGEVAIALRKPSDDSISSEQADRTFRLLMSREFTAAYNEDKRLRAPHPLLQACGFDGPAIVPFERLSEISRSGMIVREVESFAQVGKELRKLLERANAPEFVKANTSAPGVVYSPELENALASNRAMRALCEFLVVGTDVLASLRNGAVANRGIFHQKLAPEAFLAHGSIETDIITALAQMIDVRIAFLSVFDNLRSTTDKNSALNNDILAKFYGLTSFKANLASSLMEDFSHTRSPGPNPNKPRGENQPDDVRESIAEIVNHLGRDGQAAGAGINAVQAGAQLSRIMLPKRFEDGAAARGDDSMWRNRYRDWSFWMRFQSPGPLWYAQLSMRQRDREALRRAIDDLRKLLIANLDWAPSSLTARVTADLATGVSAISINPAFARSMRALVEFNGRIVRAEKRWNALSTERQRAIAVLAQLRNFTHGLRGIEKIESISNPARLQNQKGKQK